MRTETITYQDRETTLGAYFAFPDANEPRPAVMVCHAWSGQTAFEREKAEALATLGYVGVALDNYGHGVVGKSKEENAALMGPLMEDRAALLRRMRAGLDCVKARPEVDSEKLAAMGYCFGGLCVLDLARSGAELRGVISLHGSLKPSGLPEQSFGAKVLILHGWDDRMVPPEQVAAFMDEMKRTCSDYQLHAYGHTVHAFTNPAANDPAFGTVYNQVADARSWAALQDFLQMCFA